MLSWQDRAKSLGWRESDLRGVQSLMDLDRSGAEPSVRVFRQRIEVSRQGSMEFSGTDREGRTVVTRVSRPSSFVWRRRDPPVSFVRAESEEERQRGCVLHGAGCDADELECGFLARSSGVVSIDPCGCRRWHAPGCPADAQRREDRREAFAEARAASRAKTEVTASQAFVPPHTKIRKPSKKNGWKLPGQERLDLPAVKTSGT